MPYDYLVTFLHLRVYPPLNIYSTYPQMRTQSTYCTNNIISICVMIYSLHFALDIIETG